MNMKWLKARQTKYSLYVTLYVVVILAVLVAANWLANRHNFTHDTTSNKRFSLAEQTSKVVRELKSDVKITYFDRTTDFQRAKDLLDRYGVLSTKLSVDYIDPEKQPHIAKQFGVRTPGTIYIDANGKREEARSLTEEEVTSALIRALKSGVRNVCGISGSDEHSFDEAGGDGFSRIKELLERNNYKTRSIRLLENPEIPPDCTIVVIGGPRHEYVQPVLDAVKKFFAGGGKLLVMLDPPLAGGKRDVAENAALVKLLEEWGVTLNKNLVLDTSGIGRLWGLSEAVPLGTSYESHVIVRDLREVATAFPLARSVEVKSVANFTAEKLVSTSANSYATDNLSAPAIKLNPDKDKKGPFTLAVAASPNLSSGDKSKGARLVVVGSSSFMANSFLGFAGNRDLSMNVFNWLSADEDLISIRPKDPQDRRLNLSRRGMNLLLYSSLLGIPLLVIAAGMSVWWRRR